MGLGMMSASAFAQEKVYHEGPVKNVGAVRTEYGKFDEYMRFLDTNWKKEQEAAKKAGLILSYEVLTVEPRGPDDPDIYLVVTYKNWAALDELNEKGDAVAKEVYGSITAANQGAVDRGKLRRSLGSTTMQVLDLK
jgi:hypothetical protein